MALVIRRRYSFHSGGIDMSEGWFPLPIYPWPTHPLLGLCQGQQSQHGTTQAC